MLVSPGIERVQHPVPSLKADDVAVRVRVASIPDGDSLWVTLSDDWKAEAIPVRLYGIDSPERYQVYGEEAQAALYRMVWSGGYEFMLKVMAIDQFNRVVAILYPAGGNPYWSLNFRMVQAGHARWYSYYGGESFGLDYAEQMAREQSLGLWSYPEAVAPWDYRLESKSDLEGLERQLELTDQEVRAATLSAVFWAVVWFVGVTLVVFPIARYLWNLVRAILSVMN